MQNETDILYGTKMENELQKIIDTYAYGTLKKAFELYKTCNNEISEELIEDSIISLVKSAFWCGASSQITYGHQ